MLEASASNVSSFISSTTPDASPLKHSVWQDLKEHAARLDSVSVAALLDSDEPRLDALSFQVNGLLADFSRQKIEPLAKPQA